MPSIFMRVRGGDQASPTTGGHGRRFRKSGDRELPAPSNVWRRRRKRFIEGIDSCADPNQIEEIDDIVRSHSNASVPCRAAEFLLDRRSVNVDATLMCEAMIAGLCGFANVGGF
jgi:hypothetical protein